MRKIIYGIALLVLCSCEQQKTEESYEIRVNEEGFSTVKLKKGMLLFREGKEGDLDLVFYDFASNNSLIYTRENGRVSTTFSNGEDGDQINMIDINGDLFPDIISNSSSGHLLLDVSLKPLNPKNEGIDIRKIIKEKQNS